MIRVTRMTEVTGVTQMTRMTRMTKVTSMTRMTVVAGVTRVARMTRMIIACKQALLFGRVKRVSRERASERRSREGQRKGELATIPYKFSFVLHPDEGKYHWLKNDVPEIKVD